MKDKNSSQTQNIHVNYLEARAVVGELADAVKHQVDNLLADGVVATSVVVGSVLLARDELLGVVELAVGACAHFVAHSGLEVDEHAAGHVLAGTRLGEERVERVVAAANSLVGGHLAVGLDAVLKAVKLPAGIAGLDAGLACLIGEMEWGEKSKSGFQNGSYFQKRSSPNSRVPGPQKRD